MIHRPTEHWSVQYLCIIVILIVFYYPQHTNITGQSVSLISPAPLVPSGRSDNSSVCAWVETRTEFSFNGVYLKHFFFLTLGNFFNNGSKALIQNNSSLSFSRTLSFFSLPSFFCLSVFSWSSWLPLFPAKAHLGCRIPVHTALYGGFSSCLKDRRCTSLAPGVTMLPSLLPRCHCQVCMTGGLQVSPGFHDSVFQQGHAKHFSWNISH